ncbi:Ultraviolet-b receptor uvr8 [Thalictrum thalictroides]|uniref:Ultraviolet-b receptor uvr8 n=1 Tax=Thalictrum thalictroides TaxID=46969 RepID=A0A7J6V2K3_THATH|nr:Ultraviolet-b receptor uvr8 [Thalictrum thalictroides]
MADINPIILAWGSGEDGQLGIGDNEDKEWVCSIKSLESQKVASVVAGSRNSLAICQDGKLFTWGWNQRGTLGHPPETKTENIPSQVKALANVKIAQAAIGGWHCLAVDDQGRAYAWGGNEYRKDDITRAMRRDIIIPQRCAPKLSVRQVAAGGTHSVVLTHEGHVWKWGQPWPPGDIKQISTPVRVQGLEKVKLIAVGTFHNLALIEDGILWAWVALSRDGRIFSFGRGDHGRLGYGRKVTTGHPMDVPINISQPVSNTGTGHWCAKLVACGGRHTLAIATWQNDEPEQ